MKNKCGMKCEVFSRVCGYFRPVRNWNRGKQAEFEERREYDPNKKNEREKEEREDG